MSIGINPVFHPAMKYEFPCDAGVPVLKAIAILDTLAHQINVPSLQSFDAFAHIPIPAGFKGDPEDLTLGQPPQWYDPSDGIRSLEAIIREVAAKPGALAGNNVVDVVYGVQELKRALERGLAAEAKFHFRVF